MPQASSDAVVRIERFVETVLAYNEIGLDTVELVPLRDPLPDVSGVDWSDAIMVLDESSALPRRALLVSDIVQTEDELTVIGETYRTRPGFEVSIVMLCVAFKVFDALEATSIVPLNRLDLLRDRLAQDMATPALIYHVDVDNRGEFVYMTLLCTKHSALTNSASAA